LPVKVLLRQNQHSLAIVDSQTKAVAALVENTTEAGNEHGFR